jgi:hypothetical protein
VDAADRVACLGCIAPTSSRCIPARHASVMPGGGGTHRGMALPPRSGHRRTVYPGGAAHVVCRTSGDRTGTAVSRQPTRRGLATSLPDGDVIVNLADSEPSPASSGPGFSRPLGAAVRHNWWPGLCPAMTRKSGHDEPAMTRKTGHDEPVTPRRNAHRSRRAGHGPEPPRGASDW